MRLFGEQANQSLREILQDWAVDSFTATEADHHSNGQHAVSPAITANERHMAKPNNGHRQ